LLLVATIARGRSIVVGLLSLLLLEIVASTRLIISAIFTTEMLILLEAAVGVARFASAAPVATVAVVSVLSFHSKKRRG
jgi:hypothetical protein